VSMRKPAGFDRQVRYGRILGMLFAAAGFVVIGLGWNGMAKQACPDCQLPYLLSGGATGLGLIVFGASLILVAGVRAERIEQEEKIDELIRATGRVGSAVATAAGEPVDGLVVAGTSTYHRPDCRLVQGKELDKVTVATATATGLTACRVCSPQQSSPEERATAAETPAPAKKTRSRKRGGRKKPEEKAPTDAE